MIADIGVRKGIVRRMSLQTVNSSADVNNNAEDGRQFTVHFKELIGMPTRGIVFKSKSVEITVDWVASINKILDSNAANKLGSKDIIANKPPENNAITPELTTDLSIT